MATTKQKKTEKPQPATRRAVIAGCGSLDGQPLLPAIQALARDLDGFATPSAVRVAERLAAAGAIEQKPTYGVLANHVTYGRNASGKWSSRHRPATLTPEQIGALAAMAAEPADVDPEAVTCSSVRAAGRVGLVITDGSRSMRVSRAKRGYVADRGGESVELGSIDEARAEVRSYFGI